MDKHLSASSIESEVDRVEHAKTGTRLANELAAAGAAYLVHMRTAGGIAAIPGTVPQQYVVAGTLAVIGQVLQQDVGAGWKPVPIEPTEDMITSGFESWPHEHFSKPEEWAAYETMTGCQQAAHRARLCWAAMLAAAPTFSQSPAPIPANVRAAAALTADEAKLYRDLTGDVMALGYDGIRAALEALRKSGAPIPEQVAQGSGHDGLRRFGFDGTLGGDFEEGETGPYVLLADVERLLATQSAKQGAQPELTPLDYRAQGREEALAIILAESAENPFSACVGWSRSGAPGDEGGSYWEEEKLRALLHIGDRKHDAYDRAEAAYWRSLGEQDEAKREMLFVKQAPFYEPLHAFLAKHEAWDLMGDLKRAATQASVEQATGAKDDEVLALHRQLAAEKLRADQAWTRAEAKSKECVELRERMAAGAPASLEEVRNQAPNMDAAQLAELILADPDGGYMRISSELESCTDGSMRFTVTNPDTGRRFGIHIGLTELLKGERIDRASTAGAEIGGKGGVVRDE